MEEDGGMGQRGELLANVQRLTRTVLNRLEEGSREGTLDTGQVRMLGSIALRSLRLWREALGRDNVREEASERLRKAEAGLTRKKADPEEDPSKMAGKPVGSKEGGLEA